MNKATAEKEAANARRRALSLLKMADDIEQQASLYEQQQHQEQQEINNQERIEDGNEDKVNGVGGGYLHQLHDEQPCCVEPAFSDLSLGSPALSEESSDIPFDELHSHTISAFVEAPFPKVESTNVDSRDDAPSDEARPDDSPERDTWSKPTVSFDNIPHPAITPPLKAFDKESLGPYLYSRIHSMKDNKMGASASQRAPTTIEAQSPNSTQIASPKHTSTSQGTTWTPAATPTVMPQELTTISQASLLVPLTIPQASPCNSGAHLIRASMSLSPSYTSAIDPIIGLQKPPMRSFSFSRISTMSNDAEKFQPHPVIRLRKDDQADDERINTSIRHSAEERYVKDMERSSRQNNPEASNQPSEHIHEDLPFDMAKQEDSDMNGEARTATTTVSPASLRHRKYFSKERLTDSTIDLTEEECTKKLEQVPKHNLSFPKAASVLDIPPSTEPLAEIASMPDDSRDGIVKPNLALSPPSNSFLIKAFKATESLPSSNTCTTLNGREAGSTITTGTSCATYRDIAPNHSTSQLSTPPMIESKRMSLSSNISDPKNREIVSLKSCEGGCESNHKISEGNKSVDKTRTLIEALQKEQLKNKTRLSERQMAASAIFRESQIATNNSTPLSDQTMSSVSVLDGSLSTSLKLAKKKKENDRILKECYSAIISLKHSSESKYQRLETQYMELKDSFSQLQSQTLQSENTSTPKESPDLIRCRFLEARQMELEKAVSHLESKNRQLKADIKVKATRNQALEKSYTKLEDENDKLKDEVDDYEQRYGDLSDSYAELESKHAQLLLQRKLSATLESKCSDVEARCTELQESFLQLESQNVELKIETESLNQRYRTVEIRCRELEEENLHLRIQMKKTESKCSALEEENSRLTIQKQETETQMKEKQAENDQQLKDQWNGKEACFTDAKAETVQLQKQNQELLEAPESLEAMNIDPETGLQAASEEINVLTSTKMMNQLLDAAQPSLKNCMRELERQEEKSKSSEISCMLSSESSTKEDEQKILPESDTTKTFGDIGQIASSHDHLQPKDTLAPKYPLEPNQLEDAALHTYDVVQELIIVHRKKDGDIDDLKRKPSEPITDETQPCESIVHDRANQDHGPQSEQVEQHTKLTVECTLDGEAISVDEVEDDQRRTATKRSDGLTSSSKLEMKQSHRPPLPPLTVNSPRHLGERQPEQWNQPPDQIEEVTSSTSSLSYNSESTSRSSDGLRNKVISVARSPSTSCSARKPARDQSTTSILQDLFREMDDTDQATPVTRNVKPSSHGSNELSGDESSFVSRETTYGASVIMRSNQDQMTSACKENDECCDAVSDPEGLETEVEDDIQLFLSDSTYEGGMANSIITQSTTQTRDLLNSPPRNNKSTKARSPRAKSPGRKSPRSKSPKQNQLVEKADHSIVITPRGSMSNKQGLCGCLMPLDIDSPPREKLSPCPSPTIEDLPVFSPKERQPNTTTSSVLSCDSVCGVRTIQTAFIPSSQMSSTNQRPLALVNQESTVSATTAPTATSGGAHSVSTHVKPAGSTGCTKGSEEIASFDSGVSSGNGIKSSKAQIYRKASVRREKLRRYLKNSIAGGSDGSHVAPRDSQEYDLTTSSSSQESEDGGVLKRDKKIEVEVRPLSKGGGGVFTFT